MIRAAIGGKSKALLSHLTSDPPEQSSKTYKQWEQEDLIVFSWLIQNIKPTLAGNLTKYHIAKTLWDALKCGKCGMTRHTTEQCFKLIGYPDWWNDGHKKGNKNRGPKRGKAFAANTDTDRKSPTGFEGMAATTINEEDGSFSISTAQNYNTNKNCHGYLIDIRTGAIIGRGTERQWLYYVDEVTRSGTHSGQGERECIDTLSWLKYVTYEEGRNHSTQPKDPNVSVAQEAPNLIPEVSNTHSSPISKPVETTNNTSGQSESVQEQEILSTQEDTPVEQNEHMEEQENFPTHEDMHCHQEQIEEFHRKDIPQKRCPEKVDI
uniref:Putative Gag-polypeptide of LTR copia-type n=1 Tax=Tanacetum cinerariifolium TaxID=118510 RepID=A0A6L2LGH6_TANCI|nr:putative Gag-polypeptide of LTR copia-type [Tanacetum cinerariifolium]